MYAVEEGIFQQILIRLYEKLNIDDEIFNRSLAHYQAEHMGEIKQLSNLTQTSMQQLKHQFMGIEPPKLPDIPEDQFAMLKLMLIDIKWQQQKELEEIDDEDSRAIVMTLQPYVIEDEFYFKTQGLELEVFKQVEQTRPELTKRIEEQAKELLM